MTKPNLFIVGAPKSGSTFLYEILKDHPDLFFTKIKEVNHFSYKELSEASYYKDYKIEDQPTYLKAYKHAKNHKYCVDASVSYFAYQAVARRIYDFNPDAKIIILMRDPYKRAFSHYLMDIRMQYATCDFCEYIEERGAHFTQYVGNSLFGANIRNYIEVFGKEQVLVLQLEYLEQQLDRVFDFLEIENISQSINTNDRVNPNKTPNNRIASYFQKNRGVTEKLKLIIPKSIVRFGNQFLYSKADQTQKISEREIAGLRPYLKPDLEVLSSLKLNLQLEDLKETYA